MKTVVGDLLLITHGIVMHQVNCVGATGGLAGALARRWPAQFVEYYRACDGGPSMLGRTLICEGPRGPSIAHVFGQEQPGANTDLRAVELALADLRSQIGDHEPIYAPSLMGCGLGGGRWEHYFPLLEKYVPQLTIVKLEKQDQ